MPAKGSPSARLRKLFLGAPIPNSKAHHERLSPLVGLPVFSSDALSSVAYATEAIIGVLVLYSVQAINQQLAISLAIVGLIAIIAFSYRQTINAYPGGGGSYIVASENLGSGPGLVAGAALLIDYILTVAVSVAAGVDSILSAEPVLRDHLPNATITLSIFFIALIGFANLRGLRESGSLFMIPTYGFIVMMLVVLAGSLLKSGQVPVHAPLVTSANIGKESHYLFAFIVLRAFSAGCTALTGIEAVSNGVMAFKAPERKNANKTLTWMAIILTVLFLGMGIIAMKLPTIGAGLTIYDSTDPRYRTLIAQIAAFGFGDKSFVYYGTLGFTAAILILAANTAFADFPRLASLIARDGYLPRYFARQGDKLVFHNGIVMLGFFSVLLIVVFRGKLDALLPLYAVGVFTAFTLSQLGMVVHWYKDRGPGWWRSIAINAVGAVLCFVVLLIIAVTKFAEGAWLVLLLIPSIYAIFVAIKRRYTSMTKQLAYSDTDSLPVPSGNLVLITVPRLHRGILQGIRYAESLSNNCKAVHIVLNEKYIPELMRGWERMESQVPLVVLPSPYRSLIDPLLEHIDEMQAKQPGLLVTVVVPEAVSVKWYQKLLSENVTQQIRNSLKNRQNVVVANVRYFLD